MTAVSAVEKIVRTCLYEGYLLWPYRRSALKNTKRWTFGGVFPREAATVLGEPSSMRTEVLLDTGDLDPDRVEVTVRVRFLHVVDRQVVREGPDGPEPVDELTVAGQRHVTWQEATERQVAVAVSLSAALAGPRTTAVDIPAGTDREPLHDASGSHAGTLVRGWQRLSGSVEVAATPAEGGACRLSVRIDNTTPCPASLSPGERGARERAAAYAFVSTHTVLRCATARFVSQVDPPDRLRAAVATCRNEGAWPVLVADDDGGGGSGSGDGAEDKGRCGGLAAALRQDSQAGAHTVLSSPVTLYDFPAVAPESPGDLFDGTEIDRLLILSVLTLTEEEQREARACDPRAREILDRCARLTPGELDALHGAIREFRTLDLEDA